MLISGILLVGFFVNEIVRTQNLDSYVFVLIITLLIFFYLPIKTYWNKKKIEIDGLNLKLSDYHSKRIIERRLDDIYYWYIQRGNGRGTGESMILIFKEIDNVAISSVEFSNYYILKQYMDSEFEELKRKI